MTVLSTASFNGVSEGGTINNAALPSGWITVGSTFTALAAAAVHGARGARIDNVTSGYLAYQETSTSADRVMCGYFTLVDNPGASYLGQITSSGTNRADWRVNANGTVTIRNATVAVATSSGALSTGVVYRWEWLTGTGGQELRIYQREGSTPILTLTGALTNASRTTYGFGVVANGSSRDFEMDTLRVADAWTGAFVPPQAIAFTVPVTTAAAVSASARRRAAVTVPAATTTVMVAKARRRASLLVPVSSATVAAVRARRTAAVTSAVDSNVAVNARGRFRAAATFAGVSAATVAARQRSPVGVLFEAVTSSALAAAGRFAAAFTVPVVSAVTVDVYKRIPPPPIVHPLGLVVEIPTRELTVDVPTRGLAVDVPTRTLEWSLP